MKSSPRIFTRILLAAVILATAREMVRADSYSFSFTLDQKKEAGDVQQARIGETIQTQKWSYMVTMENKSFKDVSALDVKYVVFSKQEQAGRVSKIGRAQPMQRHEGSTTIPLIKNNDKVTFNTDAILLKTVQLNDDYYYANGAETRSKGALRAIWLRVYVGGVMVAEYMDPPNLSDTTTFDPPANTNN